MPQSICRLYVAMLVVAAALPAGRVFGQPAPTPASTQPAATQPTVDVRLNTEAMALPASPGYHQRHCTVATGDEKFRLTYGLFLPASYFQSKEPFPIFIVLSTAGAKGLGGMNLAGDGLCSFWTGARGDQPETPGFVNVRRSARFIGLAPQCPSKYEWKTPPMPQAVSELVAELAKTYRIDQNRIYLTGFSYGGTNTWEVALALPRRFAAIVPISGRATPDPEKDVQTVRDVGVYLACGTADKGFLPFSEQMNAALKTTQHPNFVYRLVPNGGHGCYPEVYSDPKFWDWLYTQTRGPKPATRPTTQRS